MDWKVYRWKRSWPNLRYCLGIYSFLIIVNIFVGPRECLCVTLPKDRTGLCVHACGHDVVLLKHSYAAFTLSLTSAVRENER
jgi:hypothetical protein